MPSKEEIEQAKGWLAGLDVKSEYEAISKEIIFSCIDENEETVYSAKMPILTDLEKQKIDNNIDHIAKEFTKALLKEKDMVVAQYIIKKQQERLEQLEAEKKAVIEKLEDDIERSCCNGKYKGNFRKARWQDEYAQEILEMMEGK